MYKIKEDNIQELKNFGYYRHYYSGNYQSIQDLIKAGLVEKVAEDERNRV